MQDGHRKLVENKNWLFFSLKSGNPSLCNIAFFKNILMNIILLESGSELPKDPALLLKMVSYLNQAISGKIAKMAL